VKALRRPGHKAAHRPETYPVAACVLDAPSKQRGGAGKTFDWSLAKEFKAKVERPIVLAGGLTAENVRAAIEEVQPYAVDVATGVESSPGVKDHAKLKEFIKACKQP